MLTSKKYQLIISKLNIILMMHHHSATELQRILIAIVVIVCKQAIKQPLVTGTVLVKLVKFDFPCVVI